MRKFLSLLMMVMFSVAMFAATETTVYYTAPAATIGTYTVKLNINRQGDADNWQQYTMTKTELTYNDDPVYTYTYTDLYDGVGKMQFQLYDGSTWKSQKEAISSWTGVATYNGKMYVHGTEQWVAAPSAGGGEDPITPPTPAAKDSIYFVNVAGWAQPMIHLWGGTAAGTAWPGVALTVKEANKINNFDVYKYVADAGAYANCIFSDNGANQTADLAWTSGKYFYNGAWYELDSIPAPEAPEPVKYYAKYESAEGWNWHALKEAEGKWLTDTIVYYGGGMNIHSAQEGDGKYFAEIAGVAAKDTAYFTFNPADSTLAATVTGKYVAPVEPKYYITGDSALVGKALEWNAAAIKVMADEYVFENLVAGDYKLKVTVNGDWATAKGYSDLTNKAEGLSKDNDNNIVFTLAEAGNVTVVYNDSVFTVSGKFYVAPVVVNYYAKYADAEGQWNWHALTEKEGKWLTDTIVYYGTGMNIHSAQEGDGKYFAEIAGVAAKDTAYFTFNPADSTLAATVTGKYVAPVTPEPELANGYYIIGLNGWNVTDLTANYLLISTGIETNEYSIELTLVEGNAFKVVRVEEDAIVTWYPQGENNNYVVDANHEGTTTVYFRPNYNGNEGWHAGCIFVVPTGTVDIQNVDAGAKAVKVVREGQVVIIRGEHTYTVMGQMIK